MKLQELQDRMATKPFRPFSIATSGGQEFLIEAEENLVLPKRKPEVAIVFVDSHMFIVDVASITALSEVRTQTMFTIDFLDQQLKASPFVPFTLVTNSGDRFNVKTADHADVPPIDEETGDRSPWFIVYTERSVPRYLAIINIASVEHSQP